MFVIRNIRKNPFFSFSRKLKNKEIRASKLWWLLNNRFTSMTYVSKHTQFNIVFETKQAMSLPQA